MRYWGRDEWLTLLVGCLLAGFIGWWLGFWWSLVIGALIGYPTGRVITYFTQKRRRRQQQVCLCGRPDCTRWKNRQI